MSYAQFEAHILAAGSGCSQLKVCSDIIVRL